MAAGLRGPKHELWCTICDDVSSYVIYMIRGIQFTHLPWWKRTTGSWQWGGGSDDLQR
jgi:hypothetical protein